MACWVKVYVWNVFGSLFRLVCCVHRWNYSIYTITNTDQNIIRCVYCIKKNNQCTSLNKKKPLQNLICENNPESQRWTPGKHQHRIPVTWVCFRIQKWFSINHAEISVHPPPLPPPPSLLPPPPSPLPLPPPPADGEQKVLRISLEKIYYWMNQHSPEHSFWKICLIKQRRDTLTPEGMLKNKTVISSVLENVKLKG
jgi:hypothetical protein